MSTKENVQSAENTSLVHGVNSNYLRFAFVLMGLTATISQVILLREFLVVFYGNELCIGIILGCWLFWVGMGSWWGNRLLKRTSVPLHIFLPLLVCCILIALPQVIIIRFAHGILHVPTGEYVPLFNLFYFSFLVLCPGCCIFGILFTTAAFAYSSNVPKLSYGVSEVYVFESIGSIIGGLLFSLFLVTVFSALQTIMLLAAINSLVALWLTWKFLSWKKALISALGVVVVLAGISLPIVDRWEQSLSVQQWRNINERLTFLESENSKYENLSVVRFEDQYTIFADGKPAYTISDRYASETLVHLIMIQSPAPQRVLLLGGGFHGPLAEILKYKPSQIDYVELDGKMLAMAKKYLPSEDGAALHHPALHLLITDGRSHIKATHEMYDVIIIGMGEPSTAGLNRFYTEEFFQDCKEKLTPHGIVALTMPSSADYIGPELENLNSSIYHTVKLAFPSILVIPGTSAILIAAQSPDVLDANTEHLAEKFTRLQIHAQYFSPLLYEQLMPPDRVAFVTSKLEHTIAPRLNTDAQPISYYFDLVLWNKLMKENTTLLEWISGMRMTSYLIPLLVLAVTVVVLVLLRRERGHRITATYVMFIAGFTGMAVSLLCMLNFQTIFGSIYEMVGTLIASFMAGLAIGGFAGVGALRRTKRHELVLVALLLTTLLFCLGLPYLLDLLITVRSLLASWTVTLLAGVFIGALFSTTNELYLSHSTEKRLGTIYAADLLGSCISAVVSSSILVPLLGVRDTSLLLAGMLFTGIVISLLSFSKRFSLLSQ